MNESNTNKVEHKGILAWFATNHVAANLLMMFVMVGGFLSALNINTEVFPEISLDRISITVPYRGATPADVEQGVVLRVEEAVYGIEGVKRVLSTASENSASTIIEVEEYSDVQEVLDDVKAAVDRITTFPVETEKPVISEMKTTHKVISIVLFGEATEKTLKHLAEQIRDDLTTMEEISQVSIWGVRPYEIAIEVSEEAMRRYGLSFDKVAKIVGSSSIDIPAGSIKTQGGEILVRTEGQKYHGEEFADIVLLSRNDGTKIRLGDIAQIRDAFEDTDLFCRFDGKRAVQIQVGRIGKQNVLDVAKAVKTYIEQKKNSLPKGIELAMWEDDTIILKSRMSLLLNNGISSLILVFICLLLFLDFRLAFWITWGIPTSFLGAFWLMPMWDMTINMMTLYAFILVVGIVVDDAIVVGENIFALKQKGLPITDSAVLGVKEMAIPVFLSVFTTVIAFVPLAYTGGVMGKILRAMPIIVVCVLSISLAEALLILPAHLSSTRVYKPNIFTKILDKVHNITRVNLHKFIYGPFKRTSELSIKNRYATLSISLAILIVTIGTIAGGWIKFTFFDSAEADNMVATVVMPMGTPYKQTGEVVERLEKAAEQVRLEFDKKLKGDISIVKHISATIGSQPALSRGGPVAKSSSSSGQAHLGEVNVELLDSEHRGKISSVDMKNRWRQIAGDIPGISSLTFISEIFSAGDEISIELSHENFDVLLDCAEKLKTALRQYSGVTDIADSFEEGKAEIRLNLTESGRMLGLTLNDLAQQVRYGFYGYEVQRIQRGRDDIRVMLRYPQQQRRSIADVENMRIRLADETEIPFNTVAKITYSRGYAAIDRIDRRRVVTVTADVDGDVANSNEINQQLMMSNLPELAADYPGLQFKFAGEQKERNESLGTLKIYFPLALLAMYALLAVQFRSYSQPFIIMTAIPFGIVGAVIGHLLLGYNISLLSMFGIVALAGVVVNDAIIIIDLINELRKENSNLTEVLCDSTTTRFRPILLTSLTTFLGLAPLIFGKSLQAKFLIPMSISLAFGVMFATTITLYIVPALYMIIEDAKGLFKNGKIEQQTN
ncbi:MAG: efflux RND transporter permease subunit [Planctomycetaceae bacterium]|nr:efflux RND transporter permease subunit [Planctomycetaceae bacterium]